MIEPQPIFPLIQQHAKVDDGEMFEVFNMGIGFCYVVDPADAERTSRSSSSTGAWRSASATPPPTPTR